MQPEGRDLILQLDSIGLDLLVAVIRFAAGELDARGEVTFRTLEEMFQNERDVKAIAIENNMREVFENEIRPLEISDRETFVMIMKLVIQVFSVSKASYTETIMNKELSVALNKALLKIYTYIGSKTQNFEQATVGFQIFGFSLTMYFGLCINNETCSGEIAQPRKKKGSLSTVWSSQFNRDKLLDVQLSTLMRGPNMLFLLLPFRASYSGEGELAFFLKGYLSPLIEAVTGYEYWSYQRYSLLSRGFTPDVSIRIPTSDILAKEAHADVWQVMELKNVDLGEFPSTKKTHLAILKQVILSAYAAGNCLRMNIITPHQVYFLEVASHQLVMKFWAQYHEFEFKIKMYDLRLNDDVSTASAWFLMNLAEDMMDSKHFRFVCHELLEFGTTLDRLE